MERPFSPCTRLHDILNSQGLLEEVRGLQELSLNVSTEEFLSAERAFTYADLYAILINTNTVAWLTPYTAVFRGNESLVSFWNQLDHESCKFCFKADGKDIYAFARSTEHLVEIVDVVLRLLAVSAVHSLILNGWRYRDVALINALTLEDLMELCRSLKLLSLKSLEMDEDHCRVLGGYSRPGLEIMLDRCKLTSTGTSALGAIRDRPSFIFVRLTMLSSRMGRAETVV
jgi:hypothetical protein